MHEHAALSHFLATFRRKKPVSEVPGQKQPAVNVLYSSACSTKSEDQEIGLTVLR
jgi:hypothetical protein